MNGRRERQGIKLNKRKGEEVERKKGVAMKEGVGGR